MAGSDYLVLVDLIHHWNTDHTSVYLYTLSETGHSVSFDDVVTPYNHFRRLKLSVAQQRELVQHLKSLVPRLVTKISWIKVTSAESRWYGD